MENSPTEVCTRPNNDRRMPTATPLNAAAFHEKFKAQPQPVSGKNILITGGTTGLGRAMALLLVSRGANVFIFGRHQKELDDALADIRSVGGGWIGGTTADAAKPEDLKRVFGEVDKQFDTLDVLINNAALAASSVTDTDEAEIIEVVNTNLVAYMLASKHAAERMKKRNKGGTIINIGSMSAEDRGGGSDIYVATKSGTRGFTDSLAKVLNQDGIRVTLIEPGLVGSDMVVEKAPVKKQPKMTREMQLLQSEELAQAVLYVLEQPQWCNVGMIQIRPTKQEI